MSKIAWFEAVVSIVLVILLIGAAVLFSEWAGHVLGIGTFRPFLVQGYGLRFWGGTMMVLFWAIVIGAGTLIFEAVARGNRTTFAPATNESAVDILKARYARGEINKDQYDEMRRTLGASVPSTGMQQGNFLAASPLSSSLAALWPL